jgi:two-component system, OmpR family, alkaline phosphatase synthesis response regulator PhoP
LAREKILVVDDEESILDLVKYNLDKEGYQVTCVTSGEAAVDQSLVLKPELILLDLMLPGVDGLEVCKIIKNNPRTQPVPIIMLTAKGEESDIVAGLELGADDYITKPFSPKVLIARVRAVLRRRQKGIQGKEDDLVQIDDLWIDVGKHTATIAGEHLQLTYTEFKLLHLLAQRPGWVFTRNQIMDGLRGEDYIVTERAVDVQIVGLRKKLGKYGQWIETVRGVGYRFKE